MSSPGTAHTLRTSVLRPAVVLVRTQEEGNIGATARAMANMGLEELVLVAPEQEPARVARAFAVGAGAILDRARTVATLEEALAPYSRVVGTTSARARDSETELVHPGDLPPLLARDDKHTRVAIVFGPEASGLTREELSRCSYRVRIPCDSRQPTLNLAQAVLIVAYEIHRQRATGISESEALPIPATGGEIEGLFSQLVPLLERIGYARDDTFSSVLRELRRLVARAGPTGREVTLLRGICRRAKNALDRQADADERPTPPDESL